MFWRWLIFFALTSLTAFFVLPILKFNFDLVGWLTKTIRRSPITIYSYRIPKFSRKLFEKRGYLRSCSQTGEMDIEVAFSAILSQSVYLTEDWSEADYLFIPAYPACHYQQCLSKRKSSEVCKKSTQQYLERILEFVEGQPGKAILLMI